MKERREGDRLGYMTCRLPIFMDVPTKALIVDNESLLPRVREEFYRHAPYAFPELRGLHPDLDTIEIRHVSMERDLYSFADMATVEARALFRKPRHLPVVDDILDLHAFNNGATFMTRRGNLVAISDGQSCVVFFNGDYHTLDDELPLKLLWEPDEPMSGTEIHQADYDRWTGIPKRVIVQREDNIARPLCDGAL